MKYQKIPKKYLEDIFKKTNRQSNGKAQEQTTTKWSKNTTQKIEVHVTQSHLDPKDLNSDISEE